MPKKKQTAKDESANIRPVPGGCPFTGFGPCIKHVCGFFTRSQLDGDACIFKSTYKLIMMNAIIRDCEIMNRAYVNNEVRLHNVGHLAQVSESMISALQTLDEISKQGIFDGFFLEEIAEIRNNVRRSLEQFAGMKQP